MNNPIVLKKSPVVFDDEQHRYFLGDKELMGITSTLIHRAFPKKYDGVDKEVLANAARMGHELHTKIEFYDNFIFGTDSDIDPFETFNDDRIQGYARIKSTNGLTTIANEYTVSDEQHYASQIDIVFVDSNGDICLADLKTTYTLDKSSTGLQLSIYKRFFEMQNPELPVKHIYAIWLPNKDHSIAEIHELPVVPDETIDRLIDADLNDNPFDIVESYGTLPERLREVEDEVVRIEVEMKLCKQRQEELKKGLYDLMEKNDIKSFTGQKVKLTRVLPTKSESIDTKRLKEEHPDIYSQYTKTTERSGSLKITILKQQ